MNNTVIKLATEFNRYFTSFNRVDVPARITVSRDEWRQLYAAIEQTLNSNPQPDTKVWRCTACGANRLKEPCKSHNGCKLNIVAQTDKDMITEANKQVPMTREQVFASDQLMAFNGSTLGLSMRDLMEFIRIVETHHGITNRPNKETR